jgi:hypothetical protein
MRLKMPVVVACLADTQADANAIPRAELTDFYQAWDVDLKFSGTVVLDKDPTRDQAALNALLAKHRPTAGAQGNALLIVATQSTEGRHVNGMLLDPASRGACAVFVESDVYTKNRRDDRFEVYAHELGHMLNLVHSEATETFPTAMDQWDRRITVAKRTDAWTDLMNASAAANRNRIGQFFGAGTRSPLGLPMSRKDQVWLDTGAVSNVLPWGQEFRGSGSDDRVADRRLHPHVALEIEIADPDIAASEPIDLAIALRNGSGDRLEIPAGLGLREGTIRLDIGDPSGTSRAYLPKVTLCSGGPRTLAADQWVHRSYSLLADRQGVLFPVAGNYRLQAHIPSLGISSSPVHVQVAAARGSFAKPAFQQFLAAGMPAEDAAGWRAMTHAINDRQLPERIRAHLASERVARRVIGNSSANSRLIEGAALLSPRSAQKNLLVRLARSQHGTSTPRAEQMRLLALARELLELDDQGHPGLDYLAELQTRITTKGKR